MNFILKFRYSLIVVLIIIASCSKTQKSTSEKDFCATIHRNDSTTLSKELENVAELMDTKTGVYVLEDGSGSMVARAWLTEYAEKTIDIQYFIFSTDWGRVEFHV